MRAVAGFVAFCCLLFAWWLALESWPKEKHTVWTLVVIGVVLGAVALEMGRTA